MQVERVDRGSRCLRVTQVYLVCTGARHAHIAPGVNDDLVHVGALERLSRKVYCVSLGYPTEIHAHGALEAHALATEQLDIRPACSRSGRGDRRGQIAPNLEAIGDAWVESTCAEAAEMHRSRQHVVRVSVHALRAARCAIVQP